MIGETEALARILEHIEPLPAVRIPVTDAVGLRAATEVRASHSLPRFDQSAMDGYALRARDAAQDLRIVGEQPAGRDRGLRVGAGEAVRIFTGAPLPHGANAVVMQEDVERNGDCVRVQGTVEEGEFIRRTGNDLCAGQSLLLPGEVLSAARLALLLAAGVDRISAHPLPRAAIVTTGDELRPPGSSLQAGEIIDSNGPMLTALLASHTKATIPLHAPDSPQALVQAIEGAEGFDALVLCGGVSVGDHDPVHEALSRLGAERIFWKIDLKPGKPLLFAKLGERPVFGLPGNPVSSFVSAILFLIPALRRLAGTPVARCAPRRIPVTLAAPVANDGHRPHYVRGCIRDDLFHPAPVQQSHGLSALAAANALARVEPQTDLPEGAEISAIPLSIPD